MWSSQQLNEITALKPLFCFFSLSTSFSFFAYKRKNLNLLKMSSSCKLFVYLWNYIFSPLKNISTSVRGGREKVPEIYFIFSVFLSHFLWSVFYKAEAAHFFCIHFLVSKCSSTIRELLFLCFAKSFFLYCSAVKNCFGGVRQKWANINLEDLEHFQKHSKYFKSCVEEKNFMNFLHKWSREFFS